jgi:hypothetical protein
VSIPAPRPDCNLPALLDRVDRDGEGALINAEQRLLVASDGRVVRLAYRPPLMHQ